MTEDHATTPRSRTAARSHAREARRLAVRWATQVLGSLLGIAYGLVLLAGLLVRRRRPAFAARTLNWEHRRLDRFYRLRVTAGSGTDAQPARPRATHLVIYALGCVGAGLAMFQLLGLTIALVGGTTTQMLFSGIGSVVTIHFTTWQVHQPAALVALLYVPASLAAVCLFSEALAWLTGTAASREYTVTRRDALRARIGQLVTTRRGMVQAIDDERRRIERDLHDGAQQKAVATSILIARARRARDPERAGVLLEDALTQSQELIAEIRQVAWSVYPSALDELGLEGALAGITETSALAVSMDSGLVGRPPQHVESAAFFVVREALNNAVKHSRGSAARIELRPVRAGGAGHSGETLPADGAARPGEPAPERAPNGQVRALRVVVTDDGEGRADPGGGGLRGLARRVEALDGTFTVTSPAGGPTSITAEIPYD